MEWGIFRNKLRVGKVAGGEHVRTRVNNITPFAFELLFFGICSLLLILLLSMYQASYSGVQNLFEGAGPTLFLL